MGLHVFPIPIPPPMENLLLYDKSNKTFIKRKKMIKFLQKIKEIKIGTQYTRNESDSRRLIHGLKWTSGKKKKYRYVPMIIMLVKNNSFTEFHSWERSKQSH